ncbi:hypothetical protein CEUSTIGMA_g6614.t1 [Chlamydomonas eustigma]|uniref:Phosphodiesterase n=1 Tax=Chlamydomonas eustigma TaxID=1157962 RepID=A0A250X7W6_9CHLO|nr:hypothetical protein CEUSTIGMA_g6614.t1 [Chlamydomonas eustigma]|eukprot:GAX79174.1 hypothetical protein CEUSTIGMA_g6614.t1 [Chlamydomonas eustigma]
MPNKQTPNGSLYNIQLQPFGQVRIIYPLRPADQTQYGKDLLLYPPRRALCLELIALHRQDVSVTYLTAPQNLSVVAVRQPIFINNTAPNETFGYYFDGENYTVPVVPQNVSYPPILPTGWPAGYQYNCSVCYNASTPTQNSSRWWGFVALFINLQEVTDGQDSRLKTLTDNGYSYALYAPINSSDTSQYQLVSQHGDIDFESAEIIDVLIPGQVQQTWQLWVQPLAGWYPSWTAPLIATVVLLSVLISALLFTAMMYHVRQGALLTETKLTNEELARTTDVLEEEQVRMSTLIARQYELLSCLDDMNPSVVTAKAGLTLEHIGEVRRLVNDAALKGLKFGQDQIQIKELLGEGAFGKVYKGLWRGTEVAIKTIILPANMAGAEKREKMAVMEAAISSSLIHPNIVSTYTYTIRPPLFSIMFCSVSTYTYTIRPLIDGIFCEAVDKEDFTNPLYPSEENNLVAPTQPHLPSSGVMQPSTQTSLSRNSSTGVHSFEVRLVLEYCDKGSLNDAVSSKVLYLGTELCFSAVLETAADVAKAMVHMHAAGVLHSDLKACNIMLKSSGQEGRGFVAKVADFGMSSQVAQQAEAHVSSMFQGTITHMAPETLMEGRASKAGDVYSFGILMWELLTAGDPYAEVPMALLGYAVTKLCRRPKFPAFAPHDYVQLAQRCWLPNPKDRPSFEEILETLQAMMAMHSPTCRPLQVQSIKRNFDKVHSGSYMNIKVIAGHDQDTALKASSSYQYDHDQRPHKRASQNPRAAGLQTAHHHHMLSTMPPSDAVRDDLIHLQTLSTIGSHMAPWSAATPAQDVLAMLDNFISGNQVDVGDAVKLREVILGVGKDWYQPPPALKQRLSIFSSRSEQRAADKTLRSLLVSAVDPTAMLHFQEAMAIQEEVDETGATCEGQGQEVPNSESVHPFQTRSKALPVEEASPALLEVEDTTFLHVKEPSEEVLVLLSTIDEWQFDSFALDEVSQGWPLSMLTFAILSRHGLVSPRHHVKGVQLATYLRKLEEGYEDNPYHCRAHAADVVRTLYCLLTRGSVLKTAWLPQDMDMAMILAMLAAALHDYQHKGFNNDFLINQAMS